MTVKKFYDQPLTPETCESWQEWNARAWANGMGGLANLMSDPGEYLKLFDIIRKETAPFIASDGDAFNLSVSIVADMLEVDLSKMDKAEGTLAFCYCMVIYLARISLHEMNDEDAEFLILNGLDHIGRERPDLVPKSWHWRGDVQPAPEMRKVEEVQYGSLEMDRVISHYTLAFTIGGCLPDMLHRLALDPDDYKAAFDSIMQAATGEEQRLVRATLESVCLDIEMPEFMDELGPYKVMATRLLSVVGRHNLMKSGMEREKSIHAAGKCAMKIMEDSVNIPQLTEAGEETLIRESMRLQEEMKE